MLPRKLVVFALLACGCGGDPGPTMPATPAAAPIVPSAGSWVGTTPEGEQVAFILENGAITFFQLGLRLPDGSGGSCRYVGGVYSIRVPTPGNQFQFAFNQVQRTAPTIASLQTSISGRFVSDRQATVDFQAVTFNDTDCGRGVVSGTRNGGTATLAPAMTIDGYLETCPTPAEIARIDTDLRLDFSDDPTAGTRVCSAANGSVDLSRMKQRTYQALLLMQRLEFDAPVPWTTAPTTYEWFVGVVRGIRFSSSIPNSFCCNPARTLNILTTLSSFSESQNAAGLRSRAMATTIGLLLHEARHSEGFPHTCGTDDRTIDELAAWAVHYYWYVWTSNHARAPSTLFMAPARSGAVDAARQPCSGFDRRSQGRFCRIPPTECPDPLAQ